MNLRDKKQKRIVLKMNRDIKHIYFKLNHKKLEKIKNEISRRGKIIFCKGRLFAPYIIALSLSVGIFSIFGATPFVTDKSKKYLKAMKEIDAFKHTRIISQYDEFETNENIITLYEKWQKSDDNTYFRNIKIYRLDNLSEEAILKLLNEDINNLEEMFGSPISEKLEERNYLDAYSLQKDTYLTARIYSESQDEFIYVNQKVEKNVTETILWLIILLILESFAFIYRLISPFSYKKIVQKINNLYSLDTSQMLEKRLRILETNYKILKDYKNIQINELIIKQYLSPNINKELSKLSYDELRTVLIIAMETELTLRDKLTFNDLYTYGTEIELEHVKIKSIYKSLEEFKSAKWVLTRDLSLNSGIEIVSPIMYDTSNFWQQLNGVCNNTNSCALIDKHCGLHVHVGAHILGKNVIYWFNFLKLYYTYENIIFRFLYGEFYNYRDSIMKYAPPISIELRKDYLYLKKINADLSQVLSTIRHGKYNAINFNHVKHDTVDQIIEGNTVEIRGGNGTKNLIIIQNNVNFILALFRYATSDEFNDQIIDARYETCKDIYENIEMYNEIYLEQAIELCDLIFNNNQDKIYFLNQYLKNFKIEKFGKNKTFTKKLKK